VASPWSEEWCNSSWHKDSWQSTAPTLGMLKNRVSGVRGPILEMRGSIVSLPYGMGCRLPAGLQASTALGQRHGVGW